MITGIISGTVSQKMCISAFPFLLLFAGETTEPTTETDKEKDGEKVSESAEQAEEKKEKKEQFEFKHDIAMFHSSALNKLKERRNLLSDIGPFRRALCARKDLEIRRQLCKVDKVIYSLICGKQIFLKSNKMSCKDFPNESCAAMFWGSQWLKLAPFRNGLKFTWYPCYP